MADLVDRLLLTVGVDDAVFIASAIEFRAAPPNVGLAPSSVGVISAIIAGVPVMDPSVQRVGVGLLSQFAGWLLSTSADADHESVKALTGALPIVAALAQVGDAGLKAEFVDFAALCAAMDGRVVEQVVFYLHRVVEQVGGHIGASALVELEHINR